VHGSGRMAREFMFDDEIAASTMMMINSSYVLSISIQSKLKSSPRPLACSDGTISANAKMLTAPECPPSSSSPVLRGTPSMPRHKTIA
jgi:hypothetical protein